MVPGWYKVLVDVLTFTFEIGEAVKIEAGGGIGEDLRIMCKKAQNRRIAKLGIGTNEKAKRPDNFLYSEKSHEIGYLQKGPIRNFNSVFSFFVSSLLLESKKSLRFSGVLSFSS